MKNHLLAVLGLLIFLGYFSSLKGQPSAHLLILYVSPTGSDGSNGSAASPFRTIAAARDAIRLIDKTSLDTILVMLSDGTYNLSGSLCFDSRDSTKCHVRYLAASGAHPIISGGAQVNGWSYWNNGIYVAHVGSSFREVYANDKRAIRARTPDTGSYFTAVKWDTTIKGLTIPRSSLQKVDTSDKGTELVIFKSWNHSRLRLAKILPTATDSLVNYIASEPDQTREWSIVNPPKSKIQPYYFENSLGFLDHVGEWYLDNLHGSLYYKPESGADLTSLTVPTLEVLLQLDNVANIEFEGLTFTCVTWNYPTNYGLTGRQAGMCDSVFVASAVRLNGCRSVAFLQCQFSHFGGGGLSLIDNCHNILIDHNEFCDIGGNAITIGEQHVFEYHQDSPTSTQLQNNVISNNNIHNVGNQYYGCVGIFSAYAAQTVIQHNEVYNVPYTGISFGWGWTLSNTGSENNFIVLNKVHNVMQMLNDGGGIYTLSSQPGSEVIGNEVRDLYASTSPKVPANPLIAGIYADEGSNAISYSDNVITDVPLTFKDHSLGGVNIVAGNVPINDFVTTHSGIDKHIIDSFNHQAPLPGTTIHTSTPQFFWNRASSVDPSDIVQYYFTLRSSDSSRTSLVGGDTSFQVMTPLKTNSEYSWSVQAVDNWYETRNSASGTWAFTIDSNSTATLAVQLVSFKASVNHHDVLLEWTTLTETNNFGFTVERIPKAGNGHEAWSELSFVKGSGTLNVMKKYSFEDKGVPGGNYDYRLKQVAIDGRVSYSDSIPLQVRTHPIEFSLGQNFPNPFNPATHIQFTIPVQSKVNIRIYDILGRVVSSLVDGVFAPGDYNTIWSPSAGSGVYTYRIEAIPTGLSGSVFTQIKKMVLLK